MRSIVSDGDKIHVLGNTTTQMTAATLERCDGSLVREQSYVNPSGVTTAVTGDGALIGATLYVSGSALRASGGDKGDGLLLAVDPSTLVASSVQTVVGSAGEDRLAGVVPVGTELWIAGTLNATSGGPVFWATKASGVSVCDFTVAAPGRGRQMASEGNDVLFVGTVADNGYVARYDSDRCTISPCGGCGPNQARHLRYKGKKTELRAVVATAQAIYVAGHFTESGTDTSGYIAVLDRKTLQVMQEAAFVETSSIDSFNAIAFDGSSIIAAGTRENGSKAWAVRVSSSTLAPMWNITPDDGAYYDVELDGPTGVLLAGGTSVSGVVRRCDNSGVCQ